MDKLPCEVFDKILDEDVLDYSVGGQVNKAFHSYVMPRLYKRIKVDPVKGCYRTMQPVATMLEPHLSLAQRKQINNERVRVGFRSEDLLHRYIEKAMTNMINLEVVNTDITLTESMVKTLAQLKNLKELRFHTSDTHHEDLIPLTNIKNLNHLTIHNDSYGSIADNLNRSILIPMLENFKATLRSLHLGLSTKAGTCNFVEVVKGRDGHLLEALEELSLQGWYIDASTCLALNKVVDMTKLRKLDLKHLDGATDILFQRLAQLFSSSDEDVKPALQMLSLPVCDRSSWETIVNVRLRPLSERRAQLEAQYAFLSSFDSLTSLILYGYHPDDELMLAEPALQDRLLQAMFKHKDMSYLKISWARTQTRLHSLRVVAIREGLPNLKEFWHGRKSLLPSP